MSGTDFLTSEARFFVKRKLHKKCGVFEACKKVIDFFDTLKKSEELDFLALFVSLKGAQT